MGETVPEATIRRRALISGRVQGVFFRDTTRREAHRHGVCGWVRNLPDGRVEAEFEGERGAVEAMLAFARTGPEHALVEDVEVSSVDPEGCSGFHIR